MRNYFPFVAYTYIYRQKHITQVWAYTNNQGIQNITGIRYRLVSIGVYIMWLVREWQKELCTVFRIFEPELR